MTTRVDLNGRGHSVVEESYHNGSPARSVSFCGCCIFMGMLANSGPCYVGWLVRSTTFVTDIEKDKDCTKTSKGIGICEDIE